MFHVPQMFYATPLDDALSKNPSNTTTACMAATMSLRETLLDPPAECRKHGGKYIESSR